MLKNNWMLIFTLKTCVGCIVKVRLFADHLPAYLSEKLSRRDWHLIEFHQDFSFLLLTVSDQYNKTLTAGFCHSSLSSTLFHK